MNLEALEEFGRRPDVAALQIERLKGVDPSLIGYRTKAGDGDFSRSLIDHLFTTPNEQFDKLIDVATAQPADPALGEVYIPVVVKDQFPVEIGDQLNVAGTPLTIAGFIRDGQMASPMAGSTCYLVHPDSWEGISGQKEAIIGVKLAHPDALPAVEQAFKADPELPHNGQFVTAPMIKLITVLSSGLVAFGFIAGAVALMGIALVSLWFIIRGTIEDQIRTIGVLKALGLSRRDVAGLFLLRYHAVVVVGCVIGLGMATLALFPVSTGFAHAFGHAPLSIWTFLVPLCAVLVVAVVVEGLCGVVLRKIAKIEPVPAMVHGRTDSKTHPGRVRPRIFLRQGVKSALIVGGIAGNKGQWLMLSMVFFIATVLVAAPVSMVKTFASPSAVDYLGIERSDVIATIQFPEEGQSVAKMYHQLREYLERNETVERIESTATVLVETKVDDKWELMTVEYGNFHSSTLHFVEGKPPSSGEIALSQLSVDKREKHVGDTLSIRDSQGNEHTYPLVGVYQDVTSGGFTAKLAQPLPEQSQRWTLHVWLKDPSMAQVFAAELEKNYSGVKAQSVADATWQIMGPLAESMRWVVVVAWIAALSTIALVTVLFVGVRVAKDKTRMGTLNVLGFEPKEIQNLVLWQVVVAATLGIIMGLAVEVLTGKYVLQAVLSIAGVGLRELPYSHDVIAGTILPASLLLGVCGGAAFLALRPIRCENLTQYVK
ncbi:ABC transporter permease [Corynebacterium felinum]